jgi:uncharacterized protein
MSESETLPRYCPQRALPPYSYVPGGDWPHPTGHEHGHSFGREAHEAWESLWHACGRSGSVADLLKGLIKLAAAGVKSREGRPKGVKQHAARSLELLTAAQCLGETPFGLALADVRAGVEKIAADSVFQPPRLILMTTG